MDDTSLELSAKEMEALRAVCDVFVPSLQIEGPHAEFWRRAASDNGVVEKILPIVSDLPRDQKIGFHRLLSLLSSPMLGLTWKGPLRPLQRLGTADREELLRSWSRSSVPRLRQGFQALKKMACFLHYGLAEKGTNPCWHDVGYPGPLKEPLPALAPLTMYRPRTTEETLACDVLVIGSGAGGGLAAGMLAESGLEVVLIEKGPYLSERDFTGKEAEMVSRLYEAKGGLASADGSTVIFAGSCLGGGTTVNWAGSFETPPYILQEWAREYDLPHLTGDTFAESLLAVQESLHVTVSESVENPQNAALRRGSESLGQAVCRIPRNVRGCLEDGTRGCGYCGFGCRKGKKMSTLATWVRRAAVAGARILADTEVERLEVEAGQVRRVRAVYRGQEGQHCRLEIRPRRVVVAAGSLHTPALLLRSGLAHPQLGRNLFLHPTVAVAARYPHPMNSWWGAMMSNVNDEFVRLSGNYGFKIETPPVHVGMLGLAMPWVSGWQHKRWMLEARHMGSFMILTRDRRGGRVRLDAEGRPRIAYRLHPEDRELAIRGLAEAARIHAEAGAEEIILPHNSFPTWQRREGRRALEWLVEDLPRLDWRPNSFPVFTAHQMGSCRMGGRASEAPVAPDGRLRGVRNLWVADASVFPSASGVNPMITIQALAHHTLRGLLAEL